MARIKTEKNISRKDVIVSKAAVLFREKGFKAASMRDLAESVGVEAASLYNHIKSKIELLHEICFGVANRFMHNMEEVESESISSIAKVEKLLRFHISEMVHHYEAVYVSDREWKHLKREHFTGSKRIRDDRGSEEESEKAGIKEVDRQTGIVWTGGESE